MTRTEQAAKYLERAKAAAAAGFTNEARRKEALEFLSLAYSGLRDGVQKATWAATKDSQDEARHWDLGLPYELHNLRAKHREYALEVAPDQLDTLNQIDQLKALRDEYRAAALVPKVKVERKPQPGDRIQLRGNCQCCGRDQAVNHVVAQHGYEVKNRGMGGYFSGVCSGHQFVPMQVSRDVTNSVVRGCRDDAARLDERAAALRDGTVTPETVQGRYNTAKGEYDRLPFAQGTVYQKRDAVEIETYRCEARARAARSAADDLEKLADRVHGQPLREVVIPGAGA